MYAATRETNLAVGARSGTTLTANASTNTEAAAWTELIASTDAEVQGFYIRVSGVHASGTDTGMLLDIAYGDVGGGNEVALITDLSVGNAQTASIATMGKQYFCPQKIPASKSVSARIRAVITVDTCVVAISTQMGVVHLADVGVGVTYGVSTAASRGTSTPLANGAYGAWTEIGTTSENHNLFLPAYDGLSDTTLQTSDVLCQLGYGATAPSSGGTAIEAIWMFGESSGEDIVGPFPPQPVYVVIPSGTKLWARLAASSTDNRGISIIGMSGTAVSGSSGGGPLVGGRLVAA